jgi:Ring finger domain
MIPRCPMEMSAIAVCEDEQRQQPHHHRQASSSGLTPPVPLVLVSSQTCSSSSNRLSSLNPEARQTVSAGDHTVQLPPPLGVPPMQPLALNPTVQPVAPPSPPPEALVLPHVPLVSFASYREHAQDRALYGPANGPANGGGAGYLKIAIFIIAVLIAATSWHKPCNRPLAGWLFALAAIVLVYGALIKLLYYGLRTRYPVSQQVIACALYHATFPILSVWVLVGAFLVLRQKSCAKGVIALVSFYVVVFSLFYMSLILVICVFATGFKLWTSRSFMHQGISNLCHNIPFSAAPNDALRAFVRAVYSSGERSSSTASEGGGTAACAICLEAYEDGQHLLQLPCDPPARHIFHTACITQWLSRSRSCPLCKKDVVP